MEDQQPARCKTPVKESQPREHRIMQIAIQANNGKLLRHGLSHQAVGEVPDNGTQSHGVRQKPFTLSGDVSPQCPGMLTRSAPRRSRE